MRAQCSALPVIKELTETYARGAGLKDENFFCARKERKVRANKTRNLALPGQAQEAIVT